MQSNAPDVNTYFAELPEERKAVMTKLRSAIKKNLPKGFQEVMGYGAPGWVVPRVAASILFFGVCSVATNSNSLVL